MVLSNKVHIHCHSGITSPMMRMVFFLRGRGVHSAGGSIIGPSGKGLRTLNPRDLGFKV